MLLTAPGKVVADTKSYLYLDPGRLLERAPSMWDPNIGLGTVTHQNIGYLFPMGPYYWVTAPARACPRGCRSGSGSASILLFAALGVLFLLRTLHVRGPGRGRRRRSLFMLSPYTLDFAARISVILLPWAGLPWMLALVIRALRDDGGWKYAGDLRHRRAGRRQRERDRARVRGDRARALGLYAWLVTREVDWRRASRTVGEDRGCSRCSRRCGGSPGCGRRAGTASTS